MKDTFTFIDLFSGIGGFHLSLSRLGGTCLGFSEINKPAIKTYCLNTGMDERLNFGDITEIKNIPTCDILTAGVPCQSWSSAGKKLGFDDSRGELWNDTLYILNKSKPKAFIFENVKGLADPRNKTALDYIMKSIENHGYHAGYFVLDSSDYGSLQSRSRVYIIGFLNESHYKSFNIPNRSHSKKHIGDILWGGQYGFINNNCPDMFIFSDTRGGVNTIHSWDLIETSDVQKKICLMLLENRRKKKYGVLDGNPLSLKHFQELDNSVAQKDIDGLIELKIMKSVDYKYVINNYNCDLTNFEKILLGYSDCGFLTIDNIKNIHEFKKKKVNYKKVLASLIDKAIINCVEIRYDFQHTKISTGINGVYRILLPNSKTYPTLVASGSNDFISLKDVVELIGGESMKNAFIREVYDKKLFRKIEKQEACVIQGFPKDYILPNSNSAWMKQLGNSISICIVSKICENIIDAINN